MYDAIIVGGGIGGAVLAHLLCRSGKKVLVLERGQPLQSSSRPEVLWPHTIEFLRQLLPPDSTSDWLLPLEGLQFWLGERRLGRIAASAIQNPATRPTSTAPHVTRRLLLESAGCEVLHGVEVGRLLQEQGVVTGVQARCVADDQQRHWEARLVVGGDGVHSLVREQCGLALKCRTVNLDLLSFGVEIPGDFEAAVANIWVNTRRSQSGVVLCGLIPLPRQGAAGLIAVRPRAMVDEAALNQALADFSGQNVDLWHVLKQRTFPQDFVHVKLQWGNCDRYFVPGAALIGDAAHPVTPAGGQGANLAIADARCLADCLLQSELPELARYQTIRRRAARRSLAFSRGAALVLSLPELLINATFPTGMRLVSFFPSLMQQLLRRASTAFQ